MTRIISAWKADDIIRAGILLCALTVVVYCIWISDRGFEITDEAYYLLNAIHADSIKAYVSAQQWVSRGIWSITGSISSFRLSGLFLLLIGASVLSIGVHAACRQYNLVSDRTIYKFTIISGSIVGALLYASTINLSPGYNLLASASAYAAAGLVLMATSQSIKLNKYSLYSLSGCLLAVELVSKFPAGIATLALLLIWIALLDRSIIAKIIGSIITLLSVLISIWILLLLNTSMPEALQSFNLGMQANKAGLAELVDERLLRYYIEYQMYLKTTITAFVVPIISIVLYALFRKTIFAIIALMALMVILLFGSLDAGTPTLFMSNISLNSYVYGGVGRHVLQITAIFAMLIMAITSSFPIWGKNWYGFVLVAGLFILPYTVAIGTGNAIFTQVIDSLAPWGALVSLFAVARFPAGHINYPVILIGIIFMVTITLQILTSSVRPYHLPYSLFEHDRDVAIGSLGDVKVDESTYEFLKDMKSAAKECNIEVGAPYLGLYNISGVALALQAKPLISPWLVTAEQAEFVLDNLSQEEQKTSVVAVRLNSKDGLPIMPQHLEKFPEGYRFCGEGVYPYLQQKIQIWYALAK